MYNTLMTKPQNWKLLETQDVSPSPFFPLEKRTYQMPNGKIVDDFFVTTLADCAHVVAISKDKKIVLIKMYKQGENRVVTQFPAGRLESKHKDIKQLAVWELEEETGIKVDENELIFVYKQSVMTTKSTEQINLFLAKDVEINSVQKFDDNEDIEVLLVSPNEVDELIESGEMNEGGMIADWYLVKKKFPELF